MKKTALTILTVLIATQAWGRSLPEGRFFGKGLWTSQAGSGAYQVETLIAGNSIKASYSLPDGSKKEWSFETISQGKGFFTVKVFAAEVGSGYCLEKAEVCHYEVKAGNLVMEETITFMNNKLYRFGSKDLGSGRIVWQEALDQDME